MSFKSIKKSVCVNLRSTNNKVAGDQIWTVNIIWVRLMLYFYRFFLDKGSGRIHENQEPLTDSYGGKIPPKHWSWT